MKKILLAVVMACPMAVWAQDNIKIDVKPGLWERTLTTTMSGMQAPANMPQLTPEQLAQMPPEARARIEAMMKGGAGAPQTITMKSCATKEEINNLFTKADKNCTYKVVKSSATSEQVHLECNPGNSKMVGDVNLDRIDPEHVQGSGVVKASGDGSVKGAPQNLTVKLSFNYKWLSSDCGDVKPDGGIK